jgi:hypothetical protein
MELEEPETEKCYFCQCDLDQIDPEIWVYDKNTYICKYHKPAPLPQHILDLIDLVLGKDDLDHP